MSLNFSKLSKSPRNFLHLAGVSIEEFRELVENWGSSFVHIALLSHLQKTHTIKSEMTMSEDGKIISVSKCYSGKIHDFTIKTEQRPLPRDCEKYGDLGYQGWQKLASNLILPIKKKKNQLPTKSLS